MDYAKGKGAEEAGETFTLTLAPGTIMISYGKSLGDGTIRLDGDWHYSEIKKMNPNPVD